MLFPKVPGAVASAVIFALAGCTTQQPQPTPDASGPSEGLPWVPDKAIRRDLPSCDRRTEFFSVSPLAPDDFHGVVPIGTLAPTGHVFPSPHLYLHVRRSDPNNFDSVPVEVPLVSPGDVVVTQITRVEAQERPDWSDSYVGFYACAEFKGYFDHVKTLAPRVWEAYNATAPTRCDRFSQTYEFGEVNYTKCDTFVRLDVKAGESLGTAGGGSGQLALDFGAVDYRNDPHFFVDLGRWRYRPDMAYVACALDAYPPPLRDELKSRLGSNDRGIHRTIEPVCGTVAHDVEGTAMGVWFVNGTDELRHEAPHLALVSDNIEPQKLVFSVGTSVPGFFGKFLVNPKNSGLVDRPFRDMTTDDAVYCYEVNDTHGQRAGFTALVHLVTPTELRLEKRAEETCGAGPWPLKAPQVFVR